jgi:hypothetical protein
MSGEGFGSLYYTDCLPGQGLRGGAGFQFQAVSAGVSHEVMTLVQRTSLYEAPVAWMREQRAVSAYPPSLTHVFEDVYVTARGIYLGAEANGVREGNQFTHAVATADPEAYGLTRPAQFWDAPWWSERPAATTSCDPINPAPEPGPWGVDAVREWVLAQPDAEDWLVAVHSAFDRLHGPDHRRVLFVGDDVRAAVGWIAAGTLLLPQARALRVSFRALASSPQYNQHDILVLHQDWAGQLATPRRDGEFLVFNLVTGQRCEVEPTASARSWVPRFLRDDPYDVIDAVELAHHFAVHRPGPAADQAGVADGAGAADRAGAADHLASGIVVFGDVISDVADASAVAAWLADQPGSSTEDMAEPVVKAVLAGPVDTAVLRALDRAAHGHKVSVNLASRLRSVLLTSEVDDIVAGRGVPNLAPLPPVRWREGDQEEAVRCVETAADGIEPERMDLLLRTVTRFDVRPEIGRFRDGAHRFVRWWSEHPGQPIDPARWSCKPELVDQLRDELNQWLISAAERDRIRRDIRRHWWRLLLPEVTDPAAPLDAAVCSASFAAGERHKTMELVFDKAAAVAPRMRGDVAWSALFDFDDPDPDELLDLLRWTPAVSRQLASHAFGVLDEAAGTQVTADVLDALALLDRHGVAPAKRQLLSLAKRDALLREWHAAVIAGEPRDGEILRQVPTAVLYARSDLLLDCLLERLELGKALAMARQGGSELHKVLAVRLPQVWSSEPPDPRRHAALALAYFATSTRAFSDALVTGLEQLIKRWIRDATPAELASVGELLAALRQVYKDNWLKVAEEVRPPPDRPAPSWWPFSLRKGG